MLNLFQHLMNCSCSNQSLECVKKEIGELEYIMEDWKEVNFDEIVMNLDKKRIPLSSKERELRRGCYRYFGAQGVIDYVDDFIFEGKYLLLAEDGENLKSRKQQLTQLVSGKFWVNNHAHIFQGNPDKCLTEFLYYLLNSIDFTPYITGSAQPKLSQQSLSKIFVKIPPLPTQQKIAQILSSLDDKIELNNKINANLEQQAQALFKSWFVDFEPFGGEMPAGWKEENIYSIANIIYGSPFASKLFNTEKNGKPIIRIRDLKDQHSDVYTPEERDDGYLIQPKDIVVGMDGEFRPYIWGSEPGWLNQRVCVFENKRPKGKAFLYFCIKPLLDVVEKTQVATTVIHIGKKDFDKFRIILPTVEILDKFDEITDPIIEQIVTNRLENKKLSNLRDTLLPKLMNGEIEL